jgi:hypothetical protein
MNINKTFLIIVLLFSIISCRSNNKINDGFVKAIFNVDSNLLSKTPTTIDNIFQITYPLDFNQIEEIDFQKIKTAIESDSTSFFQLSPLAIYKSSGGSTSILSKIISEEDVFNEIDTTYYNVLADNFETKYIDQNKIKINGINTIQYIITTTEVVLIKLIFNVRDFYYQLDYIIPIYIYEEKLKSIESSIGSVLKNKEGK